MIWGCVVVAAGSKRVGARKVSNYIVIVLLSLLLPIYWANMLFDVFKAKSVLAYSTIAVVFMTAFMAVSLIYSVKGFGAWRNRVLVLWVALSLLEVALAFAVYSGLLTLNVGFTLAIVLVAPLTLYMWVALRVSQTMQSTAGSRAD